MNKLIATLIFCSSLITFSNCTDDDDASPITVFTDLRNNTVIYSNEICEITIETNSIHGPLNKINVSSFDSQRGVIALLDSIVNKESVTFKYFYKAPMLDTDSTNVKLTFSATNINGDSQETSRTIKVIKRDYLLQETAGITLYSVETDEHPNALCLENLRPIMYSLADSADIDLFIPYETASETTIPTEWHTNTNIYFARANNFDYGNATYQSVTETYAATISNPKIKGLKANDIILAGRGNKAICVIKIVQIFDETGNENDRYIINIKKI